MGRSNDGFRRRINIGPVIAFRIISGYVTQPLPDYPAFGKTSKNYALALNGWLMLLTPQESGKSDQANIPLPPVKEASSSRI